MQTFAWIVLAAVFADELAAVAAAAIWGDQANPRWLLLWLMPLLTMIVWWAFASPKAPFGGPVVRPVVKVVVFSLASLALWDAGRPVLAVSLLVFSIVVNGLAQLPRIREVAEQLTAAEASPDAR